MSKCLSYGIKFYSIGIKRCPYLHPMEYNHSMIRRLFLILILLVSLLNCGYFDKPFNPNEQVFKGEIVSEIPLYFNNKNNNFLDKNAYLDIYIESQKQQLALALGHSNTSISLLPSTLAKYDHVSTGKRRKYGNQNGEKFYLEEFIIPKVKIGNSVIYNLKGMEHKHPSIEFEKAELLGLFFLKQFNVLIDYKLRKLILYQKGFQPHYLKNENWLKLQFETHYDEGIILPAFSKKLNRTFKFALLTESTPHDDQGNTFGIIRSKSKLGKYLQKNELLTGSEGNLEYSESFSLSNLKLDDFSFKVADYELPEFDGLLFYPLFSEHPIFLDFERNEIYIKESE